jgi:ABC-type Fe3+-siderophore transport system permease subunit
MLSLMTVQWSQWLGAMAPVPALLGLAGQDADEHASKALPIVMGVIFGAFCGAVVGMILVRLIRFIAYMAGGNFEGHRLVFACALIGAGVFVWLALK